MEHNGIKVEFIGQICEFLLALRYRRRSVGRVVFPQERSNPYEFLTLQQELVAPGELKHSVNYDFEFKNVEKQYETYRGINVRLRWVVGR